MAIQKQNVNINFAQGLDTKTDPFHVKLGKFLELENSVFGTGGQLKKRNGFANLTALPSTNFNSVSTYNGNLTAIGSSISAFSAGSSAWVDKGFIKPLTLNTTSIIRSNSNQIQQDSVVASNGLSCTAYTDVLPSGTTYKYVISDSTTGQTIVGPSLIPTAFGVISYSPRVFLLGNYFIIVISTYDGSLNHLQYIAISTINPTQLQGPTQISSQYTPSTTLSFDGFVVNNRLFIAWNTNIGGGAIKVTYLTSTLSLASETTVIGSATLVSVCSDSTNVFVSFYDAGINLGYIFAVDQNLNIVLAKTLLFNESGILNITSSAQSSLASIFYEKSNNYSYDSSIPTHLIRKKTCTIGGTVSASSVIARSVGLASKSFIVDGQVYMLSIYSSAFQPTYFLIDSSGRVIFKLAYSNASSYFVLGLPNVTVVNSQLQIGYLVKDLIQAVNKSQGAANAAGIYSQLGINLVTSTLNNQAISTSEIGSNLNLASGFLWAYDGNSATESGFFLWPDNIEATWSATGGAIHAQPDGSTNTNAYFYQVTYEWTDNQGNIFRSAPSVPVGVTTTGAGVTGSITVNVPTLRLTYKIANPVKIVIYRWSVAQQAYYQTTSISSPLLNDPTVDSVSFVDTLADSSILGNNLIYTTGGVIENIAPSAVKDLTLYKSRLWAISAEDQNLLLYSKQVIEATPVEMSDLFTVFVAPTTGAQGSTSVMECIVPLDDKLIIFKKDAIYYMLGNGPDNTGANNDFSEPVFITSTVGCSNKKSIVFMPNGLMFQSDKGIWLLGRDLSTNYIGADVEKFNGSTVMSALNIPGTNEVRFALNTGEVLLYDYYYNQWGTFTGIPSISGTIYQNLHTFIDKYGRVFQEKSGSYLDGSSPVLMSFRTAWANLAGLQGYERFYYFYLLGSFISPHKLQVRISFDYAPDAEQTSYISPQNVSYNYGLATPYGNETPYGGPGSLEQWRVFMQKQRCQSFQLQIKEVFDSTYQTTAGAGLTLSGLNCVMGMKKGWFPINSARSVG